MKVPNILGKFKISLILKFSLYTLLFLVIILIVLMSSVLKRQEKTLALQLTERGKSLAEFYAVSCAQAIKTKDDLLLVSYTEAAVKAADITYAGAWDMGGKVITHSDPKKLGKVYRDPETLKAIEVNKSLVQLFTKENERYYNASAPIMIYSEKKGVVQIGLSTSSINQKMKDAKDSALFISLIVLILGGVGAAFLAYLITKPLRQFQLAIETISKGRKGVDLNITGNDEIGQLAKTVDQAVNQIQERYQVYEDRISGNRNKARFFLEKIGSCCFKDGIIFTDPDNNILFVNDRVKEMLFTPEEEVVNKHILEVIKNTELIDYVEDSMKKPNQIIKGNLKSINCKITIVTAEDKNKELVGTIILLEA